MDPRPSILFLGAIYEDTILYVPTFSEDQKTRLTSKEVRLGGNVINTLKALQNAPSFYSHNFSPAFSHLYYFGSVGEETSCSSITRDLQAHTISPTLFHRPGVQGTHEATIICSESTNTRTILSHPKNIPEPTATELSTAYSSLPKPPDWIHTEARNCTEVSKFLRIVKDAGFSGRISIDVERDREGIWELVKVADVVFMARDYAELLINNCTVEESGGEVSNPLQTAMKIIEILSPEMKHPSHLYLLFGSYGSFFYSIPANSNQEDPSTLHHTPAYPTAVIETIGAGDSYIAGALWAYIRNHVVSLGMQSRGMDTDLRSRGMDLGVGMGLSMDVDMDINVGIGMDMGESADYLLPIDMATLIAGRKCGRKGFAGLWEGVGFRGFDGGVSSRGCDGGVGDGGR
ncbi:Ribokinase-like protein [Pyronema omphalodes]|nr:Ribokinase-like protein [Pyronema omphalodes]